MAVTGGISSGVVTARRIYADPQSIDREARAVARTTAYNERWAWANNSAFDDLAYWHDRLTTYGLYKRTRLIYNPFARLVEFYASQVYPGFVPQGDMGIPRGAREAIPLDAGTDEDLVAAIRQLWQWSNWQVMKDRQVELGAALGDVLVEVVDDVAAGRVAKRLWWPGHVTELDLDWRGNVQTYALEFDVWEDAKAGTSYRWKRRIDKGTIRFYRNDREVEVLPNPYTFVPAAWVMHRPGGDDRGAPAMRGTGKVEELNSLVSRMHDYIAKRVKAPKGIASKADKKDWGKLRLGGSDTDQYSLVGFPDGTSSFSLAGDIEPAQAMPYVEKLLAEIEADNPELTAWNKLREMGEISGIAIERALGDTQGRLYRAQASYDFGEVKTDQMAIAIAGWRLNTRAWGTGTLDEAREKFRPFDLDSYAAGDLDFSIIPRPLIPPTETELYAAQQARAEALQALVDAGIPEEIGMLDLGWSRAEADAITKEKLEVLKRQQALAESDLGPNGEPPPAQ